jgi:hypothetical protein
MTLKSIYAYVVEIHKLGIFVKPLQNLNFESSGESITAPDFDLRSTKLKALLHNRGQSDGHTTLRCKSSVAVPCCNVYVEEELNAKVNGAPSTCHLLCDGITGNEDFLGHMRTTSAFSVRT